MEGTWKGRMVLVLLIVLSVAGVGYGGWLMATAGENSGHVALGLSLSAVSFYNAIKLGGLIGYMWTGRP